MIFKNTFKLLLSNFSLTYKVLIYKFLILLLALGLAGTIGTPFLMHLSDIGFFNNVISQVLTMFESINLGNIFIALKDLFLLTLNVIINLDANIILNAVLFFSVFILVYGLLGNFSELAVIDCLNSNLSSKTRLSYFKSLISKMFKSLFMTVIKFFISILYLVCIFAIFYFGFTSFDNVTELAKILIPTTMFLLFVIVTGIHLTLITGFAPSIIVNDEGVFKGLILGFKAIKKKFFTILSTAIMIVLILTISNLIVSVFSFFAGIIFTIPISYVIICLFKIVAFYESNGMRYYVGDSIRTPLKKGEQDKIEKLKYIV